MIESVSLDQMDRLREIAGYGDSVQSLDYVYLHISPDEQLSNELLHPMRFNGMIIFAVKSGHLRCSVNMERYQLDTNCMAVTAANSIITFDGNPTHDLDADVLFVSSDFIRDLNFEIIVLNNLPIASNRTPVVRISADGIAHLSEYMRLLDRHARQTTSESTEVLRRGIARSLLTATLYQLMLTTLSATPAEVEMTETDTLSINGRPRSRRMLYTHEFVRLVRKNFRREHAVKFYAERLCISPKYLSLVVKECIGRSAAEVIDEHLLLEAKNLLRFSGKNIQQVAYELNFSNQSSFGKYFKHLTGMSPSEFQNS